MTDIQDYVKEQPLEVRTFFALVETTAALVGASEKYWSANGTNGARIRILVEIAKAGGSILPSELAARIGVTKANISVMLIPLEELGYVRSSSHPEDGRKRTVALSPDGERLLSDLLPGNRATIVSRMKGLEEAEMIQFLALLTKLQRYEE
ncbi:MarR family winged helix-turn-helix transcriptional regulator [Paenibacillus sacheonensis]|uniref:MarR family transcriptional regulator n=1 Tax=Paenibacillus sacheonensis TaxID=742054 RepID=A0A7X5C416_9BACL|nr:MarR family transcriptional regulator [Paenibacillus sacheonensis]MBM7569496.1 DNA-binding MarR family transcriptional regulator [Paenibacillus sacheonensis]NBC71914.1 MarR family transcriptional regulator [Paenibacillus sacheonensis]